MTSGAWRLVVVAVLTLSPVSVAAAAQAHGGDESGEGYVLVQQALAHLAHGTGHEGMDLAMEKVDDALAAKDQEGVDVAEVRAAKAALEAGRVDPARALLGDAITEALAGQPTATGYETGTGLVPPGLDGRGRLGSGDWLTLVGSVVVGGAGVWLSLRFRPHDSLRALQVLLGPRPAPGDPAPTGRHAPGSST